MMRYLRNDLALSHSILTRRTFQCLIQVTNRCNMRCGFCDFWPNGVPNSKELQLTDYRNLSLSLAKLGHCIISIEGGEPLVRADLVDIIGAFADQHVPLLFTNGWYVTADLAQQLFAAGLTQVGVSIDYPDAARHDQHRGLANAFERAIQAIEHFTKAAPKGGKQVHIITVLMHDNVQDIEALLQLSKRLGVGFYLTLVAEKGYRRGNDAKQITEPVSEKLLSLWKKYPHFRCFSEYLQTIDPFIQGKNMPTCNAGIQSFNVDHIGNVSPCIEKINLSFGNIKKEPLDQIVERMHNLDQVKQCQDCWTLCRGMTQIMGQGGNLIAWKDLATRRYSQG